MPTIPLMKLWNIRKRNIHITYHHTPNLVYACILPHTSWKSPERVCNGESMLSIFLQQTLKQLEDIWEVVLSEIWKLGDLEGNQVMENK